MSKKVKYEESLQALFPQIAKDWFSTKNGTLTPGEVSPKSKNKVWWICAYGHQWEATIMSRVKGSGCPYDLGKLRCNETLKKEWQQNLQRERELNRE